MTQRKEAELKEKVLDELRKVPNFRATCEKLKIPTPLFYKWKREDEDFWSRAVQNLEIGKDWINDLVDMKLIVLATEGKLPAIKYWNEFNNPRYRRRKPANPEPETNPRAETLADVIKRSWEERRGRDL